MELRCETCSGTITAVSPSMYTHDEVKLDEQHAPFPPGYEEGVVYHVYAGGQRINDGYGTMQEALAAEEDVVADFPDVNVGVDVVTPAMREWMGG